MTLLFKLTRNIVPSKSSQIFSNLAASVRRADTIRNHLRMSSASGSSSPPGAVDDVLFRRIDNAGVITLNRPSALNSLDLSMIRKIYPQIRKWEKDSSIKLIVMKGAEGTKTKAFCAGGDIRAVTDAGKRGDPLPSMFFKEEYLLNEAIGSLRIPYVAIIDGVTMGGGVGLSVHGRFRVATERTVFAMPETAIGLFPDVGGGYFLPRLAGKLGLFLALTGFRLKGRDVQRAGIATHFVESGKVPLLENELINVVGKGDGKEVEKLLGKYHDECILEKDKQFELTPHLDKINTLFDGATIEEILKKLEGDGSDWAKKQVGLLRKMSPTSLKITLRQLRDGAKLSLRDALSIEYRLATRFMLDKDFYEGVRAVLIDKDQKPVWNPSTVEAVTDNKVQWYFSPLSPDQELRF